MSFDDELSRQIDSLIADMGSTAGVSSDPIGAELDALLGLAPTPTPVSTGPRPVTSTGPGVSTGPGPRATISSGPGVVSTGPGFVSSGPGISTGPGMVSSGPGLVSSGPGRVSTGPGFASTGPGFVSSGPGISTGPGMGFVRPQAAGRGGGNLGGMATHTPEGKAITVNGPPCDYCGQMIIGRVTNAMNKTYHPEHFVCANCSQPFKAGKFLEHEGKPYCEDHYYELFAPRCYRCEQPIKERVVRALGHTWHPNHFTCTGCGMDLTGKPHKEAGGDPYCPECKKNVEVFIDPKIHMCARCKKPIIGWYVTLQGQRMHPEHFRCEACGKEFTNGDCHEHNGKLYCKEDYDKLQKANCAGCRKPIIGRSVTAMGRVWHPEHFCCTHCHAPFAGSQFYERDGLPYCELHFAQLFGRPCSVCSKPVYGDGIETMGKCYHAHCFTCQTCDEVLDMTQKFQSWEGKPLCKRCYLKLPSDIRKQIQKLAEEEEKIRKRQEREEMREVRQAHRENKSAATKMKKEMKDQERAAKQAQKAAKRGA